MSCESVKWEMCVLYGTDRTYMSTYGAGFVGVRGVEPPWPKGDPSMCAEGVVFFTALEPPVTIPHLL